MKHLQLILLWATLLAATISTAQVDRVIIEREGQQFFVHQVEAGHTLYSLSKLYQTSVEDIEAANPGTGQGLSIGQTLYIPVPKDHNPKEWTNPVRIEDGVMIHKVKKRETLYGICREYTVDINRMLEFNPDAERGIQPGMELRIPPNDLHEADTIVAQPKTEPKPTVVEAIEHPAVQAEPQDSVPWVKHTVEPGETLYSLTRKFDVDQDDLLRVNDGLPAGLRAGEEIYIPIRASTFQKDDAQKLTETLREPAHHRAPVDSVFIKDRYKVVLMLPLGLDIEPDENGKLQGHIERLREISMNFFRGATLALDSLEKMGANFDVTVMDVHNGSDIESVLKSTAVKEAHLIIGPFQRKPLEKVAEYASTKGVHLVCPVPQSNALLLRNPNMSKVQASPNSQMRSLANHIFEQHRGENIVLINSKEISDIKLVEVFKKTYLSRLRMKGDTSLTGIAELEGSSKFVGDLGNRLSKGRRNIIIVPAGNQSRSMIANLQTTIQLLSKDYDIVIYGLNEWVNYDFLDVQFKERTHLVVPSAVYTNYDSEMVVNWIDAFRNSFETEPSDFAFMGHDIMTYYGMGLLMYGINFPNVFKSIPQDRLMHVRYRYAKTGLDGGYENEHVFLLHHQNFYLEPIEYARQKEDR